jgi:arginine/ornithine N-succinyltransferase beta subunit
MPVDTSKIRTVAVVGHAFSGKTSLIDAVLFISKAVNNQGRVENRIIAEIMPPLTPERGNLFWDHYGRRMTGLSFQYADRLSIHDKEFIRALFPDAPLYTFLLPEEVRAFLGAVGEQSRGAVRLLERAMPGFRTTRQGVSDW